jgi:histidyl-tRNA synthetase
MGQSIKSIKGVRDILPDAIHHWHFLEHHVRELMDGYGYREMRTPLLEKTELFKRSIGDVTDIVEKEMYSFEDRNGDLLSLRPENTASCVRAAIQHGMLTNNQVSRIWYAGPMFRRENPQRGRYRQFAQVGAEAYGLAGPYVEAELILLSARLWHRLGLHDHVALQINTLGSADDRELYRTLLVEYLTDHLSELDEDSRRRLQTNPLRVLDTKNPNMRDVVSGAPQIIDHLQPESAEHFDALKAALDACGVSYEINTRLVRGLDYYCHTVFEWVTSRLGAQGTVCAGGRYDGLTEQLGAKLTPGVGWALGMDRLVELIDELKTNDVVPQPDVYMILAGDAAIVRGLALAETLRNAEPHWTVICDCSGGSMKSQFKKADKSVAKVAVIIGESELENGTAGLKNLREKTDQQTIEQSRLIDTLRAIFV